MKKEKMISLILADKRYLREYNEGDLIDAYSDYIMEDVKFTAETVLSDKTFLKSSHFDFDNLAEDYSDYISENTVSLKPTKKTNYIGIEMECYSHYSYFELMDKINKLKLNKIVQVVGDGSIEPDFGTSTEFRILLPESQLALGLKKISKLFTKGKFGVNDSCGLHVHLDMRNRNVEKCHKQLLKFQDVLFGLVSEDRWSNNYCKYATKHNQGDRYLAINKQRAYIKHKTIEIRLHQGTLDFKRIEQWSKLLLKIINGKDVAPKPVKANIVDWTKKEKVLSDYVAKNYTDEWFKQKPDFQAEHLRRLAINNQRGLGIAPGDDLW